MSTLQGTTANVQRIAGTQPTSSVIDVSMALPLLLLEHEMTISDLAYVLDVDSTTAYRWQQDGWPSARVAELCFTFGITIVALSARQDALKRQLSKSNQLHPFDHDLSARAVTDRLEAAGMVRLHDVRPSTYELYCFACGRGIGHGGTLRSQRTLPRKTPRCYVCNGTMFAREILTGASERSYQEIESLVRESSAA